MRDKTNATRLGRPAKPPAKPLVKGIRPGLFYGICAALFATNILTLVGFLFKPAGRGPFPLVIWNHGSEPNPGGGPQFDSVAQLDPRMGKSEARSSCHSQTRPLKQSPGAFG